MDYANFDRILRELNTDVYVPSQEEIDAMLTPVKEVKVLSQEEADSILSSIKNDDKLKKV
jgi:flagellar motor switch protein FliM